MSQQAFAIAEAAAAIIGTVEETESSLTESFGVYSHSESLNSSRLERFSMGTCIAASLS